MHDLIILLHSQLWLEIIYPVKEFAIYFLIKFTFTRKMVANSDGLMVVHLISITFLDCKQYIEKKIRKQFRFFNCTFDSTISFSNCTLDPQHLVLVDRGSSGPEAALGMVPVLCFSSAKLIAEAKFLNLYSTSCHLLLFLLKILTSNQYLCRDGLLQTYTRTAYQQLRKKSTVTVCTKVMMNIITVFD